MIVFNRIAGQTHYGLTPVDIPVSPLDESLGSVRLQLRDLPEGLYHELNAEIEAEGDYLPALRRLCAWAVAGHDPNEFAEQTEGGLVPLVYQSVTDEYNGKASSVASSETIDLYERALPKAMLLRSIRIALVLYRSGRVPTPRLIWDTAAHRPTTPT